MKRIPFKDCEIFIEFRPEDSTFPVIFGYLEPRDVLKEGDRWVTQTNFDEWKKTLSTASDEDEKIAAGYIEAGKPNKYLVFVPDTEAYNALRAAEEVL